ncbi:GNAT family N-acetyltransferase [Kribbella sp. NPDC051952]|uniref:GNAT family N-acetyltransferase n=1 Tax=Kribbella sp. NPDC051952 TaxID=3154851 RepID=UPI0034178CE0
MTNFADYQPDVERQELGTPVEIRPARDEDLDACAALIVTRTGGPAADRRKLLVADLANPDRHTVVACVDGEVIGYAAVIRHQVSPTDPPTTAPSGYYLIGLIVAPEWRRHGIGDLLTQARMRWTATRADHIYYFANLANAPTLDLHVRFGFSEVTRNFTFPKAPLQPGSGVLLRAALT